MASATEQTKKIPVAAKQDRIKQETKHVRDSTPRMNSMVKILVQNRRQLQFITGKKRAETIWARLQAGLREAATEVAVGDTTKANLEQAVADRSDALAHRHNNRRTMTGYSLETRSVGARSLKVQARGLRPATGAEEDLAESRSIFNKLGPLP